MLHIYRWIFPHCRISWILLPICCTNKLGSHMFEYMWYAFITNTRLGLLNQAYYLPETEYVHWARAHPVSISPFRSIVSYLDCLEVLTKHSNSCRNTVKARLSDWSILFPLWKVGRGKPGWIYWKRLNEWLSFIVQVRHIESSAPFPLCLSFLAELRIKVLHIAWHLIPY